MRIQEAMLECANEKLAWHMKCCNRGWEEFYDANHAELRGMLKMMSHVLGRDFEITPMGIVEAEKCCKRCRNA